MVYILDKLGRISSRQHLSAARRNPATPSACPLCTKNVGACRTRTPNLRIHRLGSRTQTHIATMPHTNVQTKSQSNLYILTTLCFIIFLADVRQLPVHRRVVVAFHVGRQSSARGWGSRLPKGQILLLEWQLATLRPWLGVWSTCPRGRSCSSTTLPSVCPCCLSTEVSVQYFL